MTNKELELIGQLTEAAITVAELKAENKILKDINEKLMQALRIHDVVGQTDNKMDAREKLDEFAELQGWDKNKLIGWSEAADFGEWLVENCSISAVSGSLF